MEQNMLWTLAFYNIHYHFRYYTVQYTEDLSGWQTIQEKIDYSGNSYSARNLKPFTSYKFRLQAANDIGVSGWSENSEDIRTLPAAPIEPPTDIKVWITFSFFRKAMLIVLDTVCLYFSWQITIFNYLLGLLNRFKLQLMIFMIFPSMRSLSVL